MQRQGDAGQQQNEDGCRDGAKQEGDAPVPVALGQEETREDSGHARDPAVDGHEGDGGETDQGAAKEGFDRGERGFHWVRSMVEESPGSGDNTQV